MQGCSQNIAAPFGTEGFEIKIYGHYFEAEKIDHKVLLDYHQVAGATEKEAALKALAAHGAGDSAHYRLTCVEVGGCRHFPGAGRIYFFDGQNPLENFKPDLGGIVDV